MIKYEDYDYVRLVRIEFDNSQNLPHGEPLREEEIGIFVDDEERGKRVARAAARGQAIPWMEWTGVPKDKVDQGKVRAAEGLITVAVSAFLKGADLCLHYCDVLGVLVHLVCHLIQLVLQPAEVVAQPSYNDGGVDYLADVLH
jgi:hypothetical protein